MPTPRNTRCRVPRDDYRRRGRECAFANMKLMARALGSLYDEILRPCGLTASELALVWAIVALEPTPLSGVAAATLTDATTLSRTVMRLCDAGLCTLLLGDDKRTRIVATTALGRRRLRAAMPYWERAQTLVATLVPLDAVERLARHLRRSRRAVAAAV
ncbi:MAG: MarR family transcriptional regulator [Casimicrobiaceae bacterium]